MPDHAVGGIDRLVQRGARKSRHHKPKNRRNDAIGEILRQAFDCCARNPGTIELSSIAADNVRYCLAAGVEILPFKRGGDIGDIPVQAALRDQRAREHGDWNNAERQAE